MPAVFFDIMLKLTGFRPKLRNLTGDKWLTLDYTAI